MPDAGEPAPRSRELQGQSRQHCRHVQLRPRLQVGTGGYSVLGMGGYRVQVGTGYGWVQGTSGLRWVQGTGGYRVQVGTSELRWVQGTGGYNNYM